MEYEKLVKMLEQMIEIADGNYKANRIHVGEEGNENISKNEYNQHGWCMYFMGERDQAERILQIINLERMKRK